MSRMVSDMTSGDTTTNSESARELTSTQALELARRRQEAAFRPSSTIEALVLQIIGGWEQLKAAVNMYQFLDAGPGAELPRGEENLPAVMRKLAKKYRIRWPHDHFSATVDRANKVRQRFAHFFYVSSILGDEPPNRTLYFTRLGKFGDSHKGNRSSQGLEWIDDEWTRQNRHEDSITEQELRDTLEELKWLIDCCRALSRLAGILARSPHLPDDHPIVGAGWWIPWRTDKDPLLVLSDLRIAEEPEPEIELETSNGDSAELPRWRRALNRLAGVLRG
jgi:hypothetical protein